MQAELFIRFKSLLRDVHFIVHGIVARDASFTSSRDFVVIERNQRGDVM